MLGLFIFVTLGVAYFAKEVNPSLAKQWFNFGSILAKLGLTTLVI